MTQSRNAQLTPSLVCSTENLKTLSELSKKMAATTNALASFRSTDLQAMQSLPDLQKVLLSLEVTKRTLHDTQASAIGVLEKVPQNTAFRLQICQSIKLIFENESFKCLKLHKSTKQLVKDKIERLKQRKNMFAGHSRSTVEMGLLRQRATTETLENQTREIAESKPRDGERGVAMVEKDQQIEKENKRLHKVNKTLDRIVSNFQKMGEIVSLHNQMFEDIEMKTHQTEETVIKGRHTLQQIYQDVNSHRGFMVRLFAVLTVIAIIYLILR